MNEQLWTDEQLRMAFPNPAYTAQIIRDTYEIRIKELVALKEVIADLTKRIEALEQDYERRQAGK